MLCLVFIFCNSGQCKQRHVEVDDEFIIIILKRMQRTHCDAIQRIPSEVVRLHR